MKKYPEIIVYFSLATLFTILFLVDKHIPVFFYFQGSFKDFVNWFPHYHLSLFAASKSFFPIVFSVFIYIVLKKQTTLSSIVILLTCILHFVVLLLFLHSQRIDCIVQYYFIVGLVAVIISNQKKIADYYIKALFILKSPDPAIHNKTTYIFILLVLSGAVLRIAMIFFTDNSATPDSSCRILISYIWSEYYTILTSWKWFLNPSVDWPPLHFYISGLLLKASSSITFVRICHSLVGIFSSFILFKITQLAMGSSVAFIATICFLFYPASIFIGTQVLSETFFQFFLLCSLYSFIQFQNTDQSKYHFIHIMSINACCLLRYEGWLLPFFYFLISVISNRKLIFRQLFTFAFSCLSCLAVCSLLYLQGFHPLRGILYSDFQVAYTFSQAGKTIFVFINGYKEAWIPLSGLIFSCSFYFFRKNKIMIMINIFTLFFALPFFYKNLTYTLFPQFRYLTHYELLLLIPFCGFWYYFFEKLIGKNILSVITALLVSVGFTVFGLVYIDFKNTVFPEGYNKTINFVNEKIDAGNFLIDHHGNVATYHWIASTRMPVILDYDDKYYKQFFDFDAIRFSVSQNSEIKKIVKYMVSDSDAEFKQTNYKILEDILVAEKNCYLVLFPDGDLSNHFSFSEQNEKYNGLNFERVFYENDYKIYKVRK